jgi:hypothetical protein
MAGKAQLTPQAHRRQIEAYTAVRPCCRSYANALKRVLEKACQVSFPEADGPPAILSDFTGDEVKRMAEWEHGRWNIERLRDGWRFGRTRDDIRRYDRDAVRAS